MRRFDSIKPATLRAGIWGVVDVSAAAIAMFATGFFSVRYLEPRLLGVYAVFVTAFGMAVVVPWRLVLVPFEVELLSVAKEVRNQGYRITLRYGAPVALVAGGLVLLAWIPTGSSASSAEILPLVVTSWLAAWLSPLQDHLRRLQHLSRKSWIAAGISVAQLMAVSVAIVVSILVGIEPLWVPFGSLFVANAVSLTVGVLVLRREGQRSVGVTAGFKDLVRSGRWLLAFGFLAPAARFVAGALVVLLVGAQYLGFAEAARIANRPFGVFVRGLTAVINPRAMEAARSLDRERAETLTRRVTLAVPVLGSVYLILIGVNWVGNPMVALVPNAYEVVGLVAMFVVAETVLGTLISQQAQLIGGRREVQILVIEAVGSLAIVAVALSAAATRAFAIPLGLTALAAVRWIGYRIALQAMYESPRLDGRRNAPGPGA